MSFHCDREVMKVLVQLDYYLKTLHLPFSVQDLYQRAYKKRHGYLYNDSWIFQLTNDPKSKEFLEEPFTIYTITETLRKNGHTPINFALYRLTRRMDITYSHAYVTVIPQE